MGLDRSKLDWEGILSQFKKNLDYEVEQSTDRTFADFLFGVYKPTLEEVAEHNGYVSGLKVAKEILMKVISCQIDEKGLLRDDETFEETDIFPEEAEDEE